MFSPYMYNNYPTSTLVPISSRINGFYCLTQNYAFTEDCFQSIEQDLVFPVVLNLSK